MGRKKKIIEEPQVNEVHLNKESIEETTQEIKSEGLGDIISKFTKALGFQECEPCKKRRDRFNKMFKWLYPQRFLTDSEIEIITKAEKDNKISDTKEFFKLYNDIFNDKLKPCLCPGLLRVMLQRLVDWKDEQLKEDENN